MGLLLNCIDILLIVIGVEGFFGDLDIVFFLLYDLNIVYLNVVYYNWRMFFEFNFVCYDCESVVCYVFVLFDEVGFVDLFM